MRPFWHILLVISLLGLAGCASPSSSARIPRTGNTLVDGQAGLSQGPAKDRVLWQYRMAAAAMRRGEYDQARQLLDEALARIQGAIGRDRSARKSRSYFAEEAKKTFLGEPYERAMAYYYRGILYWMQGEPDNARACFRSAQVEDALAEEKEHASDYVMLDYLDALATVKLGGDGSDAYQRSLAEARINKPPPPSPQANVLFFLEFGQGPTKFATGEYQQELRFLPGKSEAKMARVSVADHSVTVGAYDNITYQATTRGGRVMDHVLANKAVFKSGTDAVGDAALISGLVLAGNRNTQEAGLGLAAFGLLSKIVSSATTPAADTRAWDNLPQYLSFAALSLPPGEYQARVEFMNGAGLVLGNMTREVRFSVPSTNQDTVLFVSNLTN